MPERSTAAKDTNSMLKPAASPMDDGQERKREQQGGKAPNTEQKPKQAQASMQASVEEQEVNPRPPTGDDGKSSPLPADFPTLDNQSSAGSIVPSASTAPSTSSVIPPLPNHGSGSARSKLVNRSESDLTKTDVRVSGEACAYDGGADAADDGRKTQDARDSVSLDTQAQLQSQLQTAQQTHVHLLSSGMIKLYGVWSVALLATFMAGYGVGSMTAVNAMNNFKDHFNIGEGNGGVSTGLVFAMWPIAACATFWLGPILADRLGRRGGMMVSSLVFILGTCLMAFAKNYGTLLAGRLLLGAGVGLMQPAAPPYLAELAPPLNRGLLSGMFNCFWLLGNAVAIIVSIFSNSIENDWAWRTPLVVQLGCPVVMAVTVMFLPESPRWLYAHGQPDKARAILSKYHGNGTCTPLVKREMDQIATSLRTAPGKMFDYSHLANTRAKKWRLGLALFLGCSGQMSGGTLMMFAPNLYRQVGMTSVRQQLIMTVIPTLIGLGSAVAGTISTDRSGRRPMLIYGTFACAICLAGAMICSAVSLDGATTIDVEVYNDRAAKGTIAFLILFFTAFSWVFIPLASVYPPEVLSMEQRSTGMGLMVLCLNFWSGVGQLATPIALQNIGWLTYLPWVCWDLIETVIWYFVAVETKGRSLEELDAIFDAPNPVKASLQVARHHDEEQNSLSASEDPGAIVPTDKGQKEKGADGDLGHTGKTA